MIFQSTLPARGATHHVGGFFLQCAISIHAPREGSDDFPQFFTPGSEEFQSTLPARGATVAFLFDDGVQLKISIHAPREGSDGQPAFDDSANRDFNPRSPRGERRARWPHRLGRSGDFNPRSPRGERRYMGIMCTWGQQDFNPRSPRGERLPEEDRIAAFVSISIHAPREGSDVMSL